MGYIIHSDLGRMVKEEIVTGINVDLDSKP